MHAHVGFLSDLKLTPQLTTQLMQEQHWLDTDDNRFKFLKFGGRSDPSKYRVIVKKGGTHSVSASGPSIFGDNYTINFNFPEYIQKPPHYIPGSYPIDSSPYLQGFSADRESDYLLTFNVSSFFTYIENSFPAGELPSSEKATLRLLEIAGYQSRLGSIWRQLTTCKLILLTLPGVEVVLDYLELLLEKFDDVPYLEKNGKLVWTRTSQAVSILPLLLYGVLHLTTMLLTKVLNPIDALYCIQAWTTFGEKKYQTTKLALKSSMRNFLPEGLNYLGTVSAPSWSLTGVPTHIVELLTKEPTMVTVTFPKKMEKRRLLLPEFIISRMLTFMRPKSLQSLIMGYIIQRIASNDGTFYATIPELGIPAAVEPRLEHHIVESVKPHSYMSRTKPLKYNLRSSKDLINGTKFLEKFVPKMRASTSKINFAHEIVQFLGTSSAGDMAKKDPSTQSKIFAKASNKRIVDFSLHAATYLNTELFEAGLLEPTRTFVRLQVDRRLRTVSGTNTYKLLLGLPSLKAAEVFQHMVPQCASGKQNGSVFDVSLPLYASSNVGMITNSSDVSGYDASVQVPLTTRFHAFLAEATDSTSTEQYLHYRTRFMEIMTVDGHVSQAKINALEQVFAECAYMLRSTATTYQGDVLPFMMTHDPTFPSGLPYTSAHHTVTNVATLLGNHLHMRDGMTPARVTSCISTKVLGDDVRQVYYGNDSRIEADMTSDTAAMESIGFKIDNEISRTTSEFLQQRVICGRFLGYPDRISLFCSERPSDTVGPIFKLEELMALSYDLGNRVSCPNELVRLWYAAFLCCASRLTLLLDDPTYLKLSKSLSKIGIPHFKMASSRTDVKYSSSFVRMYLPLSVAWVEHGACLPPPRMMREDGTFTVYPSYYYMRGSSAREALWDISLSPVMWDVLECADRSGHLISQHDLLNIQLLYDYHVPFAYYFLKHYVINRRNVRLAADPAIAHDVMVGTNTLRMFENQSKLRSSQLAEFRLFEEKGVKLDRSLVYAHASETKLKQAIADVNSSVDDEKLDHAAFVDDFSNDLMLLSSNLLTHSYRAYSISSKDVVFTLRLKPLEDTIPELHEYAYVAGEIDLSLEYTVNSCATILLMLLGFRTHISEMMSAAIRAVTGTYKEAMRGDQVVEAARPIFRSGDSEAMSLFAKAVGLNSERLSQLESRLRWEEKMKHLAFKVIRSPRQAFMYATSAYGLERNVTLDEILTEATAPSELYGHASIRYLAYITRNICQLPFRKMKLTGMVRNYVRVVSRKVELSRVVRERRHKTRSGSKSDSNVSEPPTG